jgi:monoterpene epsilon-lactone hydrolase
MSFQSRLGCWWIRLRMKRKPAGEAALVEFTRRVFTPPAWLVGLHSRGVKIERADQSVKGEWILPPNGSENKSVIYYLHGGGYISGSAKTNRPITVPLARYLKRRVFALDYRLAPEHRFPAALEDALAGHRWLVSLGIDPRFMSVAGDSAGGGLALALVMWLRDLGETLPACVVGMSPWTDMTGSGASIVANSQRDPMFSAEDIGRYASLYLGAQSREDPLASPLFGDLAGLPPLLIHVGETEVLLDDARQVHNKMLAVGGSSQLRIFKGVPHGWHFGTPFVPEARESLREIADFIQTRSGGLKPPY